MADYRATVVWQEQPGEDFRKGRYSRGHEWQFDGGVTVPASSAASVVPLPWSVESAVDPEEAFVASLSSCHMLWFLALAAKAGYVVVSYRDEASGTMARNAAGKLAMTQVVLRPAVAFSGDAPGQDALEALHHQAHEECFIASSVLTDVRCEPIYVS